MAKNIKGIIKKIRKIMRNDEGVSGDAQRIEQLVWMLFCKVYDELKESNEYEIEIDDYVSIIPEELRWRNWAIDDKDGKALTGDDLLDFINNQLFPRLKKIAIDEFTPPRSAIVKYVFTDIHNYMKDGVLIRQVINELNEIDFDEYEDRHLFNDIYEEILKELQSAGSSGEFYTPRPLTDFIAEQLAPKTGEIVADFACGTGGFLTSAIKHILSNDNSQEGLETVQKNVIGTEFKPLPYLLCVTNMLLNNMDGTNITRGDSLGRNVSDYSEKDKVDVIMMNPPFGGDIKDGIEMNFPSSFRTTATEDLFVAMILYRLKKDGRVGIVLPDGFLFADENTAQASATVAIKKKLMSECNLHTILRLPSGLFYANITTNVLFFEKGKPTEGVWYYQVPLPEGYKSFSKNKPFGPEHLADARAWWNNRDKENINAFYVPIDSIIKKGYNLDYKNTKTIIQKEEKSLVDLVSDLEKESARIASNVATLKELLKGITE